MSDSYVCSTAKIKCSCGDKIATLTVLPDRTVWLTGKPQANISDHKSLVNIAPFGRCHTTKYPPTGAATAAAHGKLTPMPCIPNTIFKWERGKDDVIVKGQPALLKSSTLRCAYGGKITITFDGQGGGMSDNSRENKEIIDNKPSTDINKVLDGIQLALDAAGFIPGAGAIPDLLNAAISACRGNWLDAGMSLLAAIPVIGDAAAGAKLAKKGLKYAKKIDSARKTALAKEAKAFVSEEITKKELLKRGICKSEAEVEFFQKALRKERKDTADLFYKKSGITNKKDRLSHINGIDLDHAVKVKQMPPPESLIRFNEPGHELGGGYFGVSSKTDGVINTPGSYGIQPIVVKNENGVSKVVRKKKSDYAVYVDEPFDYLETTAKPVKAPLDNDWQSLRGSKVDMYSNKSGSVASRDNWRMTKGGATQAFIPERSREFIHLAK